MFVDGINVQMFMEFKNSLVFQIMFINSKIVPGFKICLRHSNNPHGIRINVLGIQNMFTYFYLVYIMLVFWFSNIDILDITEHG